MCEVCASTGFCSTAPGEGRDSTASTLWQVGLIDLCADVEYIIHQAEYISRSVDSTGTYIDLALIYYSVDESSHPLTTQPTLSYHFIMCIGQLPHNIVKPSWYVSGRDRLGFKKRPCGSVRLPSSVHVSVFIQ